MALAPETDVVIQRQIKFQPLVLVNAPQGAGNIPDRRGHVGAHANQPMSGHGAGARQVMVHMAADNLRLFFDDPGQPFAVFGSRLVGHHR